MWGTWEELVLGGAVLRHGTGDWNVVASELRARTLHPQFFTPQACKARYENLQKRYSGSTGWFEDLRMRRVAELKRELAKSEDSIGSLESKIKILEEEEKLNSNQADYDSSDTESLLPSLDSEATESINRETSNLEMSAGSFTKETTNKRTTWLCEHQHTKPSTSFSSEQAKDLNMAESGYGAGVIVMRKRRGPRKRKDCTTWAIKETSVCYSDNLGSSNVNIPTVKKEPLTNDCEQIMRSLGNNGGNKGSSTMRSDGLMELFKSVAESEPAAVFRHRMDSQKRARYRRVIKQHVDIGTIRSRLIGRSITTKKELFRDLLLLANNALVFYSRRTREYKSALSLRDLIMRVYKQQCRGSSSCQEATSAFLPCNPPVRPRTARPRPRPPPCKDKVVEKSSNDHEKVVPPQPEGLEKEKQQYDLEDNASKHNTMLKGRSGMKRPGPGKGKAGLADQRSKTSPVKQRKRVRR